MVLFDPVDLLQEIFPVADGQRDHLHPIQRHMLFEERFHLQGSALAALAQGDDDPAALLAYRLLGELEVGGHIELGCAFIKLVQSLTTPRLPGTVQSDQGGGDHHGADGDAGLPGGGLSHGAEGSHVIQHQDALALVDLLDQTAQLLVGLPHILVQRKVEGVGVVAAHDGVDHPGDGGGCGVSVHGHQNDELVGQTGIHTLITKEQGDKNHLVDRELHVKLVLDLVGEFLAEGILVPVVLHHLHNSGVGDPLGLIQPLQHGGEVKAQPVEGGLGIDSLQPGGGLLHEPLGQVHDTPVHHLQDGFLVQVALSQPVGHLLQVVLQIGVDNGADVLLLNAPGPQLGDLPVDHVVDGLPLFPQVSQLIDLLHVLAGKGVGIVGRDQTLHPVPGIPVIQETLADLGGKIIHVDGQLFRILVKGTHIGVGAADADIPAKLSDIALAAVEKKAAQQLGIDPKGLVHPQSLGDEKGLDQGEALLQRAGLKGRHIDADGKFGDKGIQYGLVLAVVGGADHNSLSQFRPFVFQQVQKNIPDPGRQKVDMVQKKDPTPSHVEHTLFHVSGAEQKLLLFGFPALIVTAVEFHKRGVRRNNPIFPGKLGHQGGKIAFAGTSRAKDQCAKAVFRIQNGRLGQLHCVSQTPVPADQPMETGIVPPGSSLPGGRPV